MTYFDLHVGKVERVDTFAYESFLLQRLSSTSRIFSDGEQYLLDIIR